MANLSSLGIKHVFLIIKENRTYDQVFGDIAKANGDPKLLHVRPRHHAQPPRAGRKYVLLDNFHTGGAISFDGHQWLMQALRQRLRGARLCRVAARLRLEHERRADGVARRASSGSMRRVRSIVRIYGEFQLPARWDPATQNARDMNEPTSCCLERILALYKEGKWQSGWDRAAACRRWQPYLAASAIRTTRPAIPDQIRAEEYLRELAEREKSGKMPNVSILHVEQRPHQRHASRLADAAGDGGGQRPGAGPHRGGISKSRFWANSLILVVEDDAQDGLDHVDGHRTRGARHRAARAPRRGGFEPLQPHQHGAHDPGDLRHPARDTQVPQDARVHDQRLHGAGGHVEPYQCLEPKVALDEMNPPLKALDGRQLWAAKQSLAMNCKDPDDVPEDMLNRILWWDAKGWDPPFPKR